VTRREWGDRQGDLVAELEIAEFEESEEARGCSPFGCRREDAA
jgi:hypothetical protein